MLVSCWISGELAAAVDVLEESLCMEANVGLGLPADLLAVLDFFPRLVGLNSREALRSK